IFYVEWQPDSQRQTSFREEYVVGSGDRQYRVRAVVAHNLDWVYSAIAQEREIASINVRTLRAVAARMYKLVRTDIPRKNFEVNYETLEGIADAEQALPRLLGFVEANNTNLSHPYVITQVGHALGFQNWHGARKLIERINSDRNINICETDNRYH